MVKVIFDIETNGLNPSVIWCIAAKIVGTWDEPTFFEPFEVKNFPNWLAQNKVDILIGHNIIDFDLPVLKKLIGLNWTRGVEDTLVMSRLDNPSREGGNSLEAWGKRLNFPKGDYDDWTNYSEEMKVYCIQDVNVTSRVYSLLEQQKLSEQSVAIEHEVATIIHQQKVNGWQFNTRKATSLLAELKQGMFDAEDEVREVFIPLPVFKSLKFPAKPYNDDGEISGVFLSQLENKMAFLHEEHGWGCWTAPEFNLGSRPQIGKYLIHFGWEPLEFTETGQPKVSEKILKKVDIPEAKLIANYLMYQKRVGMVASWIDAVDVTERIHGRVNSCGAVTGRMTHSKPNLAQVPATGSPYGEECRELFEVREGYKLVGCDASGLELRMLAHYMDDEEYTREVLDGDIHTANQMAAGLESRDKAKTFIYAFLYGAGDGKIGEIVGGAEADGKRLKKDFLDNTPALKDLRERITKLSKQGTIEGLDGRKLHIRSPHAALNTLFQSAGAIVMKQALILLEGYAKGSKLDYRFVGNIHDEFQVEVKEEQADYFGSLAVGSIIEAGKVLGLNCPLDADYKIGNNWAETH